MWHGIGCEGGADDPRVPTPISMGTHESREQPPPRTFWSKVADLTTRTFEVPG